MMMESDWMNTKAVLAELQDSLSCGVCEQMVQNPCTLGACEHYFCRSCVAKDVGGSCPSCGVPSHAKNIQTNRQLATAVSLCRQLGQLLHSPSDNAVKLQGCEGLDEEIVRPELGVSLDSLAWADQTRGPECARDTDAAPCLECAGDPDAAPGLECARDPDAAPGLVCARDTDAAPGLECARDPDAAPGLECARDPDAAPGLECARDPDAAPGLVCARDTDAAPGLECARDPDAAPGLECARDTDAAPGLECAGDPDAAPGLECARDTDAAPGLECAWDPDAAPGLECAGDPDAAPGPESGPDGLPDTLRQTRRAAARQRKTELLRRTNQTWGIGSRAVQQCHSCHRPRSAAAHPRHVTFRAPGKADSLQNDLEAARREGCHEDDEAGANDEADTLKKGDRRRDGKTVKALGRTDALVVGGEGASVGERAVVGGEGASEGERTVVGGEGASVGERAVVGGEGASEGERTVVGGEGASVGERAVVGGEGASVGERAVVGGEGASVGERAVVGGEGASEGERTATPRGGGATRRGRRKKSTKGNSSLGKDRNHPPQDREIQPAGREIQPAGREIQPAGREIQPAGREIQPAGREIQPAGREIQPAGREIQPAGREIQPAGREIQPAGREIQPAGREIQPAGREIQPAGREIQPAGREIQPAGREIQPAGREMRTRRRSDPGSVSSGRSSWDGVNPERGLEKGPSDGQPAGLGLPSTPQESSSSSHSRATPRTPKQARRASVGGPRTPRGGLRTPRGGGLRGGASSPRTPLGQSPASGRTNAKGETALHVAVIRGDNDLVRILLSEGAAVNAKDHAGWTPLHEACNHGNVAAARMLLDGGACINVPGGPESDSPLHDAVVSERPACVALLVARGASKTQRNLQGKTAEELSVSKVVTEALNTAVDSQEVANTSLRMSASQEPYNMCVLPTGLNREQKAKLNKCAQMLNGKMVQDFSNAVTHVVSSVNKSGACARTFKYLEAVVTGKWIVNYEWVETCLEYGRRVSEEAFEVPGASTTPDSLAPEKGRRNLEQQLPGLFSGCQFFLSGDFRYPSPAKEDVARLLKLGGATLLSRDPKPELTGQSEVTVPFHAEAGSLLADCTFFVVHDSAPGQGQGHVMEMRGPRLCRVSVSWILDSIAHFKLLTK